MAGGFDKHANDTIGKGLYIIHMYNTNSNSPDDIFYVPICADGRWDWEVRCSAKNPFDTSRTTDIIQHKKSNPQYGLTDMEKYRVWSDDAPCIGLSSAHFTQQCSGDDNDAFNIDRNRLFAPWTNPGTYNSEHKQLNFSLELISKSKDNFIVKYIPNLSEPVKKQKK